MATIATIIHDHPCPPIKLIRPFIAKSFTYDCKCGRLMIVDNHDGKVAFGKEFVIILPDRTKVKPSYIEI